MTKPTRADLPDAVPIAVAAKLRGIGIVRARRLWNEGAIPRVDRQFTGHRMTVPRWWVLDEGHGLTEGRSEQAAAGVAGGDVA